MQPSCCPRARSRSWTPSANTSDGIRRFLRRLKKRAPGAVACCYEAGPLGFGLQRSLQGLGVGCVVIAPSLTPRKPGDRIKTDRRDARKLASLFRAGLLTEVHPPTPEQEAVRDLCRFASPRALMAYLGLVPSEYSSGGVEKRGALTKAGNCRVRRLVIESAWHYRHRPAIGYRLKVTRRRRSLIQACRSHPSFEKHTVQTN